MSFEIFGEGHQQTVADANVDCNSIHQFPFANLPGHSFGMGDSDSDDRVRTLQTWIADFDSATDFAARYNLNPNYISQLLNRHRSFGEKAARKMEKACGHPKYSLDGLKAGVSAIAGFGEEDRQDKDLISIPRPDSWASMGTGAPMHDHVDIVDSLRVRVSELRRLASFTAPENLRVIAGRGPSMEPTFKDGDVLIFDVGVTELKVDAVYVMEKDKELYIKRITRHPRKKDVFVMSSDNNDHPSFEIEPERDRFVIHGRVILAWNARRL